MNSDLKPKKQTPLSLKKDDESNLTFVLLKPDCIKRGLMGKVISRFEEKGYEILKIKKENPKREVVKELYRDLPDSYFKENVDFVCSGPVCAMVIKGPNAVSGCRTLQGATKPEERLPGTIRGDFSSHIRENILHASDSLESAKRELALWFKEPENQSFPYLLISSNN